jgi:hypothetical protein
MLEHFKRVSGHKPLLKVYYMMLQSLCLRSQQSYQQAEFLFGKSDKLGSRPHVLASQTAWLSLRARLRRELPQQTELRVNGTTRLARVDMDISRHGERAGLA